jgi:galactokinase
MALHLATWIAAAPNSSGKLCIYSAHRKEMREFDVAAIGSLQRSGHWTDYPIGVAQQLTRAGVAIEPASLVIRSTVPEGSGLSSSAALEVSSALAFLNGRAFEPLEVARLCQRAEREFVGMPCGIMDQYISVFGRDHAAVEIDCRGLTHRYVRLPDSAAFVAVNTMVKHALSGSAYKDRVAECAEAVQRIRARYPGVASLRDVSPEQFSSVEESLPDVIRRRARHVVTEDARVNRFVDAGNRGDLDLMGRLLVESHRSLEHDYEVSCRELDFLVDAALAMPGVYGARMTGGGFGGCIVAMLRPESVASFQAAIAEVYGREFAIAPQIYECRPSAGAGEIQNFETIPPEA